MKRKKIVALATAVALVCSSLQIAPVTKAATTLKLKNVKSSKKTMVQGTTFKIKTNVAVKYLKFSTSKSKVATVSKKGVIKAVKKGTCYITVTAKIKKKKKTKKKIHITVKAKTSTVTTTAEITPTANANTPTQVPTPVTPVRYVPTGQREVLVSYAPVSLPTRAQDARILPNERMLSSIRPRSIRGCVNTNDPLTEG